MALCFVASNTKFSEHSRPAEGDLTQKKGWRRVSARLYKSKEQINEELEIKIKEVFDVLIINGKGLL